MKIKEYIKNKINNIEQVDEASLSRVWKHFKDDNTCVVILTAFRDKVSEKDNIKGNKQIASKLKASGFGYFFVEGHYPEIDKKTGKEVNVSETSIFTTSTKAEEKKLIEICHKLANQYDQDSIIVKESSGDLYFLTRNGNKDRNNLDSGKMSAGKIGKYYTRLRNKKETNTFVFESVSYSDLPKGFFGSYRNYVNENKYKLKDSIEITSETNILNELKENFNVLKYNLNDHTYRIRLENLNTLYNLYNWLNENGHSNLDKYYEFKNIDKIHE